MNQRGALFSINLLQ